MKKNILFILIFLFTTNHCIAQDSTSLVINDGPYISIIDDTTINIQYISQDTLIQFEAVGEENISFQGKGFDSLSSYTINTSYVIPNLKTDSASKIFIFSDIHGEYECLTELLLNNHIIDSNLNWLFGDGHLVIDGDIPDRGDRVTEIFWLIYKLEQQAEQAGGKVHYILGNHEIMVIQSDLRYINEKYKQVAELLAPDSLLSTLYTDNTILGKWLRTKNICEIINGILFVHGGLGPEMMHNNYTLDFINRTMRTNIDTPRDSIKADTLLTNLFGSLGPIWYRGYHYDMEKYKQATVAQIDSLLEFYNVTNIVVGHTTMDSTAVLYDGKIFGVNQDYELHDEIEGLYIENSVFYACDIYGKRRQVHVNK